MKKCNKCEKEKPLDDFYKQRDTKDKHGAWCKLCVRDYGRVKKREKVGERTKGSIYTAKWQKANRELVRKRHRIYMCQWRKDHKESHRNYMRNRYRQDGCFRLNASIHTAVNLGLKGTGKYDRTFTLLGYTLQDLKSYIESKFTEGMTWDNYGRGGWHLDHIIPKSFFNFNNISEFKYCWSFHNLQPLWEVDNIRKSNKLPYLPFLSFRPILAIYIPFRLHSVAPAGRSPF